MEIVPNFILDAHEDIAYNTVLFGRDYTQSAYLKRQRENDQPVPKDRGTATVGLPETLLGSVGVVFGTIFVMPAWYSKNLVAEAAITYETPQEAYKKALDQIDVYHRLAESNPRISLIRRKSELTSVLDTWKAGTNFENHRVGIVISMEGADPVTEPQAFEEWYERGVRAVGLAWTETRYSGGTHRPGPLTSLGHGLLDVMESFNTILDLSHLAEEAYLEAVDRYGGPIIASHSNPRKFCNTDRHLSDGMIRRLVERNGVMGIVPYNNFLQHDWKRDSKKESIGLDRVIGAIDHVCQISGSAEHVGIGSDFDGGFGYEAIPREMDTLADLQLIGPALKGRGYSDSDVVNILHGNFLRILQSALPT